LAATAFHLLTGSPPFQNSNPAVVISQHLSASPPAIGDRRPELSALDPVLAKALSKDPKDRFERCADFARSLSHRLGAAASDDEGGTTLAPVASPKRSLLRASVIVPAVLAVLLVAAVAVALMEFRRADRPETATPSANSPKVITSTTVASPPFTPLPPPPEPVQPPVAVIGARCSPVGSTATTADGATAYCSTLQTTGASIWSLNQGDIPSPTVTTEPTEAPAPVEEESPVRVCMQQTGQTWLRCREQIRRSNLGQR
jgi:serine/threonine-protein kinase